MEFGADTPLDELGASGAEQRLSKWFRDRWGDKQAATFNRNLDALRSAIRFWTDQGWLTLDPSRLLRRRAKPTDRTRSLSRSEIDDILSRKDTGLREATFWTMLYETAARAQEVLSLDVKDLDLLNRRAKVIRKGGAVDIILWRTGTARLLPRLVKDRKSGPVFLTERRARVPLSPADLSTDSGKARLSYRRAAELFTDVTGGATLHQLRHSALTHAAEDGANTSTLLAYSGHTSVASLSRYARVSPEALARWQQRRDTATRRS